MTQGELFPRATTPPVSTPAPQPRQGDLLAEVLSPYIYLDEALGEYVLTYGIKPLKPRPSDAS